MVYRNIKDTHNRIKQSIEILKTNGLSVSPDSNLVSIISSSERLFDESSVKVGFPLSPFYTSREGSEKILFFDRQIIFDLGAIFGDYESKYIQTEQGIFLPRKYVNHIGFSEFDDYKQVRVIPFHPDTDVEQKIRDKLTKIWFGRVNA